MLWQYQTILFELTKDGLLGDKYVDDEEIEKALNQLGSQGWELVNVTLLKDGVLVFLKRPVRQEQVVEQPAVSGMSNAEQAVTMVRSRVMTEPEPAPEPVVVPEVVKVESVRVPEPVYVPPQHEQPREPVVRSSSAGPMPHVFEKSTTVDDESDGIGNIRIR